LDGGGLNVIPVHIDHQVAAIGGFNLYSSIGPRRHNSHVVHNAAQWGVYYHCSRPRDIILPRRNPSDRLTDRSDGDEIHGVSGGRRHAAIGRGNGNHARLAGDE
jgi:hypothetical protein